MLKRNAKAVRPHIASGVSRLLEELCYAFCRDLLRHLDRQRERRKTGLVMV
jgi:hypothetical protein